MALAEKKPFGKKNKEQCTQEQQQLLDEYYNTIAQLASARSFFSEATDMALISSCVYEINALQQRYSYLLTKIKEEKITRFKVLR